MSLTTGADDLLWHPLALFHWESASGTAHKTKIPERQHVWQDKATGPAGLPHGILTWTEHASMRVTATNH